MILSDHADDTEKAVAAMRRQDDLFLGSPVMGQIVTVYDLLPGPWPCRCATALAGRHRKLMPAHALVVLSEQEKESSPKQDRPMAFGCSSRLISTR